jgi:quercetin dioxygenase-like cupin family protein
MHTRILVLTATLGGLVACSSSSKTPTDASSSGTPAQQTVQWAAAPAIFPAGAEMAVMQGDPSKAEEFTVRLRFPDGYKVPPHTHPTAENVTVLSGTFLAGMGTAFVESGMQTLGIGDFASIPAAHAHYAMAHGQTVVQVHAIGPFVLTYVNPGDTPPAAR